MPDITNYDGRLEQMAYYCEAMLDNIAKINNAYHDSVDNENIALLPDNLIKWKGVKRIGGRTIVWNQLNDNSGATGTAGGIDFTNNGDGSWTINGTATSSSSKIFGYNDFVNGHKYYIKGCPSGGSASTYNFGVAGSKEDVGNGGMLTATATGHYNLRFNFASGSAFTNVTVYPMLIDLTLLYGAGNEPTTVAEFTVQFPAQYYPYNAGTLLSAGVVSVVSKDGSDNVLQTATIPSEITTMEGYGWSCPGAYNYIDIENKKFVQTVSIRPHEAGDESDATVITDGTNTHYELDAPLEFDVDIPDDIISKVEAGGSLTFENRHGDDYRIPVPVELEYIGL